MKKYQNMKTTFYTVKIVWLWDYRKYQPFLQYIVLVSAVWGLKVHTVESDCWIQILISLQTSSINLISTSLSIVIYWIMRCCIYTSKSIVKARQCPVLTIVWHKVSTLHMLEFASTKYFRKIPNNLKQIISNNPMVPNCHLSSRVCQCLSTFPQCFLMFLKI